jgi:cyclopropane fatty-acyl-phospholipid synthase-like methyltransferase
VDHHENMDFLYELFDASLPRLGPGNSQSTKQALDALFSAGLRDTPKLKILDIGCGNGAQTLQLAKHLSGAILAVDNHQPFLDELQRRAEAAGVSGKIRTYLKNMAELGVEEGSFDLIWSEGALYSMGFQEGLAMCRSLLVPGGFMAASELTWFRPDPPAECREFFADAYPPMTDTDTNVANIKQCGYDVVGHFVLPETAWLESFYNPFEDRLQLLREQYATNPERLKLIDSAQVEVEQYRKYSSYYGYGFYLMQRG